MNTVSLFSWETNSFLKLFCSLILSMSAVISCYLTVEFMYSIGTVGQTALIFGLVGFCLDSVKSFAPSLAIQLAKRNKAVSGVLTIFCLTLMLISATASIFALQNGVENALKASASARVAQQKMQVLKKEIHDLEVLRTHQIDINYITTSAKTTDLIAHKNNEFMSLMTEASGAKNQSFLATYSHIVVYTVAVALEVIAVMMTMSLFCLRQQKTKQDSNTQHETPPSPTTCKQIVKPVDSRQSEATPSEIELHRQKKRVAFAETTRTQILEELKCALITKVCNPTHRSILGVFASVIKQKEVSGYLKDMETLGVVERISGQGRRKYKLTNPSIQNVA